MTRPLAGANSSRRAYGKPERLAFDRAENEVTKVDRVRSGPSTEHGVADEQMSEDCHRVLLAVGNPPESDRANHFAGASPRALN